MPPAAPARQHPLGRTDRRPSRWPEDPGGEADEHPAPERDQHEVDEPFAGEADEVHASLVRAHRPAQGDRRSRTTGDGQVEWHEELGVRRPAERIEVDHDAASTNGRGREQPAAPMSAAAGGRSSREERQYEQGGSVRTRSAPRRGSPPRGARARSPQPRRPRRPAPEPSHWEPKPPSPDRRESCFHSRSLCSRANSRTRRRGRPSDSPRRGTPRRPRAPRRRARRSARAGGPRARRRRGR